MRPLCISIIAVCTILIFTVTASAGLYFRATCPQAADDVISFSDADSFHVDIWMHNTLENSELCGGTFSFQFLSPDESIESVTHLMVTGGKTTTRSVEYLNGFRSDIFEIAAITFENGWGESSTPPHSIGILPDSINFTVAGSGCLADTMPDREYIRFNLRVETPGILCIDSITHQSNPDWDWLFPLEWDPVVFNGPYCWIIRDPGADDPPTINCPDDIEINCGESSDPSYTGYAIALDDNDPDPVITFSDVTEDKCPIIMTRTWVATDNKGQSSSPCVQTITLHDTAPPKIACPPHITIDFGESTDPTNTGEPTIVDDCDPNPKILYADSEVDEIGMFIRSWAVTDNCGNSSHCQQSIIFDMSTDITNFSGRPLPEDFSLSQNWPNPFNPSTSIELALPKASAWTMTIFNILGQEIDKFSGFHEAGYVEISWNAPGQSSGIYFYKARAGAFTSTRKMILLK